MSGHSKWHSIKHKKGAADAGARQALRRADPPDRGRGPRRAAATRTSNPTLRTHGAEGARRRRCRSTPSSGPSSGGPARTKASPTSRSPTRATRRSGVAVLVEALTDNRNRTGAEIKNVFSRNGGSFAEPGAVSWQFERKGVVARRPAAADEDDLMLAAARRRRRGHRPTRATRGRSPPPPTDLPRGADRARGGRHHGRSRPTSRCSRPPPSPLDQRGRGQVGAAAHRRARGARRRRRTSTPTSTSPTPCSKAVTA